ncbi:TetR/AcrR family transcriptional regulator [Amnibacterium kyonggiense]|uniref:TetR family transcriptional regulator n=1 Tax=Amnibacterium kyonggiense TaxID=595671 RepID=A0A4R7FJC4_9MICO|nr:TetR/AcrR family transcriptional regulator [Amnibacterium kyonggiense]TDS76173.1 TetR family transcriptional regulator [Amnibacterium kyonggiense]
MQDRTRDLGGSAPLLESALRQFAAVGFEGASLQRIAADAGLSKSSVLYHFASKEALLDAALRPAVEDLTELVEDLVALSDDPSRHVFLARFVDYLFEHRLAIAVIINHGQALAGHAVIDEADALVRDLAFRIGPPGGKDRRSLRFGVALSGAAFVLIAADRWATDHVPDEEVRAELVDVLGEFVLGVQQPA